MKLNNIIFHPILFGIFPVISLFESNMDFTPVSDIILPLIIIIGIITSVWIFLKIIIHDNTKSALIISLLVILFFAYGPIVPVIDSLTNMDSLQRALFLAVSFLGIGIIGIVFLIKTKRDLKKVTTVSNVISLTLILVVLSGIGIYSIENSYSVEIEDVETEKTKKDLKSLPDIYYIILDGYPGQTSLKTVNNYDNQEFLDSLSKQGFFIQKESYSNYAHTFLSIPSILNMRHLDDLAEELKDTTNHAAIYEIGSDNKVMNFVKSQGYTTISFDSGWDFTRDMKSADLKLCGHNKAFSTEFLLGLTKNSMLYPIYTSIFQSDKIERKLCVFDELPKVKDYVNKPIFVFAHILLPHPPYIFGPNGEIQDLENLDPHPNVESSLEKNAFIDQLKFVNKKISVVVSQLLDSEKQPVIIIQSDHGTAFRTGSNIQNWESPTDEMINERMDSIMFIFLPENTTNIFSDTTTSVNTFPILFNHYFETDFKILEDKAYFSSTRSFNLQDVTEILKNP